MSLIQGYSSSEDDADRDDGSAVQSHHPLSSASPASPASFPPLPAANSRRRPQGTVIALPLLEEVDGDALGGSLSDDEDDSETESLKVPFTGAAPVSTNNQQEGLREYRSDLTNAAVRKRIRQVDFDSDTDAVIVRATAALSRAQPSLKKLTPTSFPSNFSREVERHDQEAEEKDFVNTHKKSKKLKAGETEVLVREMMTRGGESDELKRATAQGVIFSEVTSNDIRSDALRFQQAGVTANLQKVKGVTGRQNQISHLAQVAMRQRDQKKQ